MLKTREGKPPQSADLLVCFPSRSHLPLMPKPICSPARPSDHNKRRHHHRRKRSISMLAAGGQGGSPSLDIAEPTSPKVTCAGQIKVRHNNTRTTACRSWQSVMEEIEKIHNRKKQRNHLGFKKEVMQFLTCLRSIRFDFRCFGSFPGTDIVTSDDDEEEEEEEDEDVEDEEGEESSQRKESGDREEEEGSRTVFSKWFMVVQEHQSSSVDEEKEKKNVVMAHDDEDEDDDEDESVTVVPPRNALLLMRCRSAPAKSWVKRENEEGKGKEKVEVVRGQSLKSLMEEEKRIIKTEQDNNNNKNKNKKLLVMRYESAADWISSDIAKETWIVGGLRETLLKARSCKR
ncbi:hypothetical protein HN51_052734 [Arachis hypogaea]|uniref:Uncharacterized protein n=1 Tax=Arachis hypogaea TaxID=3818 RepID=A0A445C9J6_ARAHY|nr:protein SQS1 [Arachis ipaensis]XP_025667979.1 protein SQS1 [Arachis hypogaea]QHN94146.1 uncharacterized protein DS421_17g598760 [Arachis hypogaea]RYR47600.1 hypothetical protein Ahy_A07g033537 [Arachis hypogaea]